MKIEIILICTTILFRMYFVWVSSISVMLNTEVTHSLTRPLIVVALRPNRTGQLCFSQIWFLFRTLRRPLSASKGFVSDMHSVDSCEPGFQWLYQYRAMHGIYLCGSPNCRRFFHCCGSFMFHNRTRVAFFLALTRDGNVNIIQLYGSIHPMQLQLTGLRNNAVR